jgi:hypothetical protein
MDRMDRAFSNRNPIPISDRSGSLREEGTTNQKKDRTISCPLIILPNNNLARRKLSRIRAPLLIDNAEC